jgi:putative transcriptional regulator
MAIIVNVDVMLAKRKMSSLELASKIDLTPANLSILKTGKAKQSAFQRSTQSAASLIASPAIFWNTGTMRNKEMKE